MPLHAILRSYSWVIHCGLIAMGAYLLADTANFFVASRLLKTPSENSFPLDQNKTRFISSNNEKHNYRSIVSGDIFAPATPEAVPVKFIPTALPPPMPIVPLPLPPPPPVIIAPPKAPLNLTLIGTVISAEGPAQSYAVIEDGRTRRQYIYRIGDFLLPDAKLKSIQRSRVVISRGEGEEDDILVTALSGLKEGTTAPERGMIPPPSSRDRDRSHNEGIRQISNGRWMMDRREVDDAVQNLPELLTKARVVPNFTDGKPDGFRIYSIRQDSLYERIGLQNGDILKRVNNIDVGNPQNFLEVFERLKGERHIRVELIRNNKEETFNYDIQ
ncbi:MAG: type II secretion system protein GspC [Nitrospirota bacterium]